MQSEMLPTHQTATVSTSPASFLMDPDGFKHAITVAKTLAASALFPAHLRQGGQEVAVSNAVLVLNMAQRMGEDPLAVAQNIYFVSGKPGWSAAYMIAKANLSGVFVDPIEWVLEGEGDDLKVTAKAVLAGTGTPVEAETSMAMAKAEGWTKNSKYQSMPKHMLQFRSAVFLIRLYCPQVMLGLQTQEEILDSAEPSAEPKDITPPEAQPAPKKQTAAPAPASDVIEAEAEPKKETPDPQKADKAKPKPEPKPEPTEKEEAEAEPEVPEEYQILAETLRSNLLEGIRSIDDLEGAKMLLEAQIDELKGAAPELHKKLMEDVKAKEEDLTQ